MKRKALGKGLDVLLPSVPTEGTPAMVDVDLLYSNERQPRQTFSDESLSELAESIRENGIVQPIVVRQQEDRYEIIAGERRWRAAQKAGIFKVPVVVMDVPDDKMLELALLENIQREDLNPIDEARAYQVLLDEKNLRQEDLANRLGKARTTITNAVRLLQFPITIQNLLESGELKPGQARPLLSIFNNELQLNLAKIIVKKGLSAREVERLAARIQKEKASVKKPLKEDPHIQAAEEKLSRRFYSRVRIVKDSKGGRIVIHFSTDEELERLYEELIKSV